MNEIEIAILLLGTLALVIFSWQFSVKAGRYHGVYRFFGFESILILVLMNWRTWFESPLSWHQLISWSFLVGSIAPAVEGFRLLKVIGKPGTQFEDTTRLVKVGAYKFIRHPLYGSLILLCFGVFFKDPSLPGLAAAGAGIVSFFATAKREEKEMVKKFGDEYVGYMKESRMFIPYVF